MCSGLRTALAIKKGRRFVLYAKVYISYYTCKMTNRCNLSLITLRSGTADLSGASDDCFPLRKKCRLFGMSNTVPGIELDSNKADQTRSSE